MKKIAIFLLAGLIVLSWPGAQAQESAPGPDGSSMENAIVINYTGDYNESIGQEYAYLNDKYGEGAWESDAVALLEEGGKYYDMMTVIITATGGTKQYYFDITEPYAELMKQFQEK